MSDRSLHKLAAMAFVLIVPAAAAIGGPPAGDAAVRGLDPSNLDPSVQPSTDFYSYADGGWLKQNPVPPDRSRWGSFEELIEKNDHDLRQILEQAAAASDAPAGSNLRKIGDFYASGMDSAAVEREGIAPIQPMFDRIAAIKDASDMTDAVAWFHAHGINPLFGSSSEQDPKESAMMIADLFQAGLGLPDRDYYLKDDSRSQSLRAAYITHVKSMFGLLGDDTATSGREAATVMAIETRLAKASLSRVELRDPVANYHKMGIDQVQALAPNFGWKRYFVLLGLEDPGPIDVGQPVFFKEMSEMLHDIPLQDWKVYLRWRLIHESAPLLSTPFVNENFKFFGTAITGARQLQPRWKRCLRTTDGELGEALGQLYVNAFFPPEAKARAKEMVENLRKVFRERIRTREWMSQETRAKALAKLDAFGVKIGYPDKWRDYSGLQVDRGPFVLNVLRADSFEVARRFHQVGKPVDRTQWGMTPPTVNAYYNPAMNEIVFPAGILQPPFFDPKADDAVNYGGMGAVIGHEMTHGFDDEGCKFDAQGNLNNWWTSEDSSAFAARTKLIEEEYDSFVPIDSLHVNGKLTLGENIADLGGLTLSYAALMQSMAGKPQPPSINGFTPAQRFFLAWAQIWRANYRPEDLRRRLIIDPHSPSRFRTDGPVENMKEFYAAFPCKPGDPMFRAQNLRAEIW